MINETTNYSMFKKHAQNRPIDHASFERLKKSVQMKNLLEFRPILVNSKMEVIDGQHRLEVAKALAIPIFYQVETTLTAEDIYNLNAAQAKFTNNHWLNYYARGGNKEYQALENFMSKYELNLSHAMVLITEGKQSKGPGGSLSEKFCKGVFVFPKGEEYMRMINTLDKINMFIEFVCTKTPEYKHLINTGALKKALLYFFNIHNVDFDVFMKKLEMKLSIFRRCTRTVEYLEIFEKIYNYKNASPITVTDMV